jgi:hypothetical protein
MPLSWNRGEDGVITIYQTNNNGIAVDVADLWLKPRMSIGGATRPKALAEQQEFAEWICNTWNSIQPKPLSEHPCKLRVDGCDGVCGSYGCGS